MANTALHDFLMSQVDTAKRFGTGYMAEKPGTYTQGPESVGEAFAFSPTPLMAGAVGIKAGSRAGGQAARTFGRALQGAKKYIPMHNEDIVEASSAIERYLTKEDPVYHVMGQRQKDEGLIKLLAGHYIGKDILKTFKNKPENIAQELLNRVLLDRREIPR